MTTQNNDLLKVVRKQQAQIDKHKTQIDELLKQNGQLISKIGTTTNTKTGGGTGEGAGNGNRGRNQGNGNRNTNGNGNHNTNSNNTGSDAGAGTNNRPYNLPKCHLIVGNWIRTNTKYLIIGRVFKMRHAGVKYQ